MPKITVEQREEIAAMIANIVDNLISIGYPVEITDYGIIIGFKKEDVIE